MFTTSRDLSEIFFNEFVGLEILSKARFEGKLKHDEKVGFLKTIDRDTIESLVSKSRENYKRIQFVRSLLQQYIDSYYIVLVAIHSLMTQGHRPELKHMVADLH